jgi:hypothetical protein
MKYLLNEHLNVLRIANIQNEEREYEEFLQSLYEINLISNYSKDQLLNESFVDKVKDTFKKATGQSKKYLQYSFNQFKKNGEKPSEFVKDIGDVFSGSGIKKPSDLKTILKLAKIYSLSPNNINEADEKAVEISSVSDLEKLQNGQKFIWKGKYEPDYEDTIGKILNPIRGKVGQTSGDIYGLVPDEEYYWAYDDANNQKYLVNNRQKNTIEKSSDYAGVKVIQKIGDFFRKHKWLTAAMVAPVMASTTTGANAEPIGAIVKAITGDNVNIDNTPDNVTGSNPDYMGDDDGDKITSAGGGDDVPDSIKKPIKLGGDGQIDNQDFKVFKDKIKSLIPNENVDDISTAATFEVGEYKLTPEQQKWVVEKGTNNVLNQIQKVIAEKGVTDTITINGDIIGHISSNAGDQDNVANDGSDLVKARAATGDDINKEIQKIIIEKVKGIFGDKVKVVFKVQTQADSNVDDQVQHRATNYTADQSVVIEYTVDTDGGVTYTIKNWQPIVAVTGKGVNDMGQRVDIKRPDVKGSEDKGSEDEGPKRDERPIPTGDADPDEAKKLFKNKNLNRNQEIFSVLKMANPNIKGDPNDTTYKSWYPTIKKVVISLRKSPDTLLKKFQQVTGINLSQRQKSTGKFKRSGVAENISLGNMLNEAAIDQTLASIGVTDDAIRKNKVEVMAMLMAMYNLRYDDVDKSKLTPEEQKQLKDITVSEELEKQIQKQRPDVSVLEKDIESNSSLKTALSRINTYDEFEALVLGMAALVNPNFAKQKQDIRTALSSLASKVRAMKEESDTPSDTEGVYKIIETLKLLKNHLNNINNREEFEQLIFVLLKYIDPKGTITKDTSKLANAIIAASNASSLKDARPVDLDKLGI